MTPRERVPAALRHADVDEIAWTRGIPGNGIAGAVCGVFLLLLVGAPVSVQAAEPLPGTTPFEFPQGPEPIVQQQLQQVLGFWQRRIARAEQDRDALWRPDFRSPEAYQQSLEGHRANCRRILGLEDESDLAKAAVARQVEPLLTDDACRIERIEIPLPGAMAARGIVVAPTAAGRRAAILVVPDADTWPERALGLAGGSSPPWLRQFAARGAVVFVLQSIERLADHPYCQTTHGKDRRMVLYRLGYPVGRTMPGLDVRDALAALDYLAGRPDVDEARLALLGVGQGGMTALYTAALDRRVAATAVASYFDRRDRCWQEPVDRRLPGQLIEFGDAELAALVAPRTLIVISTASSADAAARVAYEGDRARRFFAGLGHPDRLTLVENVAPTEVTERAASALADALALAEASLAQDIPSTRIADEAAQGVRNRHFEERMAYLRTLIAGSEANRDARWRLTDTPAAEFPLTQAKMLNEFRELVGEIAVDPPSAEPLSVSPERARAGLAAPKPDAASVIHARTELVLSRDGYQAYRVLLDVTEGVQVYGNLLVPLPAAGRRPAVLCQHGLSGTPEMITGLGQTQDTPYHEFGRRLAEQGYVVFAPLVLHYHPVQWTNDQARMADAVGITRVALPVAQTKRVVDFLQALPVVDPQRIGYYGLSYGGYSALWISPREKRLAAIVISGHFNDWRSKITSDATATSYLLHPDEDFYNWNILNRFTHVELVTMMTPRPVCIEYGRRDGITTPQWTAYAWNQLAAVRDHLGLGDRITLAEFDGVHEVRGVESFAFLKRYLGRPRP